MTVLETPQQYPWFWPQDAAGRRLHSKIDNDIERYGRSIVGVHACNCEEPDETFIPFAYTIGNIFDPSTDIDVPPIILPELLVIGVADAFFLNDLAKLMLKARKPFDDGEIVRLPGAHASLKIIKANAIAREHYTVQAEVHFGHPHYPLMQVLIPDHAGRFPDDPKCRLPYAKVPVLGLQ